VAVTLSQADRAMLAQGVLRKSDRPTR